MVSDLCTFLADRPAPVEVLALGTPAPAEPAFRRARNQILAALAEHGFRSVAVAPAANSPAANSPAANSPAANSPAAGSPAAGSPAAGHPADSPAADLELAEWLRARDAAVPPADRVRLHHLGTPPDAGALRDIRAAERDRGPTLLFAPTRLLAVTAELGDRCVLIAGSLGASEALGLGPAGPDTVEGRLGAATGRGPFFPAAAVPDGHVRADVPPDLDYVPLDAATVARAEGVWHVDRFPAAAERLAGRIRALPGVTELRAGPRTGAPEPAWDERFYFAGRDRKFPFATIVAHDLPGFDDRSGLDRAGVFRLNIEVGRAEFRNLFGYPPAEVAGHRGGIDHAAFDRLTPHPVYAVQGWVSVVGPGAGTETEVARLLDRARERSAERERRRTRAGRDQQPGPAARPRTMR